MVMVLPGPAILVLIENIVGIGSTVYVTTTSVAPDVYVIPSFESVTCTGTVILVCVVMFVGTTQVIVVLSVKLAGTSTTLNPAVNLQTVLFVNEVP
jgi:hypothetical protein